MKYVIIEEKKCLFIDENRERLVQTLKFLPAYKESDIQKFGDDALEQAYDGTWYIKGFSPQMPSEEAKRRRAALYLELVDPITAHISRLKDEEPIDEEKIKALIKERQDVVEKIKADNPYLENEE